MPRRGIRGAGKRGDGLLAHGFEMFWAPHWGPMRADGTMGNWAAVLGVYT